MNLRTPPGIHVKKLPQAPVAFPPAWAWFVDEIVPAFVKKHYSPRESWKNKPFARADVHFFAKGVTELSELFTGERPGRIPAYFRHPKFRSAYLLYFLPLQMAKFVTLLKMHPRALDAAVEHGRKRGAMRILDLGAGPGTASIAVLLELLARPGEIPPVEFHWVDPQKGIMDDGAELVRSLGDQFPRLRGKVSVKLYAAPWWEAAARVGEGASLILLGHVLNEAREVPSRLRAEARALESEEEEPDEDATAEEKPQVPIERVWHDLVARSQGGGILIVEPAARGTSQQLSRLRDRLFGSEALSASPASLWGPCPHAGACPLAQGKDWCHFSVPARVPGKWFAEFSKALSSERQWLKFSYLWIAATGTPAPERDPRLKLAISDPLSKAGDVLVCAPERPERIATASLGPVWRGDFLQVQESRGAARLHTHALASEARPRQPTITPRAPRRPRR